MGTDVVQNFESVAKSFTDHYYKMYDTNRQALASLYSESSLLTMNGEKFKGAQSIMEKISQLPNMQRDITVDSQPVPSHGSVLVLVSGKVMVEGQTNMLTFCQNFHLVPSAGSWYIANEAFRLIYG